MKKSSIKVLFFFLLITIALTGVCLEACKKNDNPLRTFLDRIERIESVSCLSDSRAFNTATCNPVGFDKIYEEVFSNSDNSFMEISYLYYFNADKTNPDILYDGRYFVRLNWKTNNATIEQITDNNMGKFPVPFFTKVRLLLRYATTHPGISKIAIKSYKDSTELFLSFPDRLIEYYKSYPYVKNVMGSYTDFTLMVNNKNHLPYKLVSVTPEMTYNERCTDIKVSGRNKKVFNAMDMIPDNFSRDIHNDYEKIALPGPTIYPAKDWKLVEVGGDTVSFKNIKSKVILLEFTGFNCSPCNEMIPFLEKLVKEYKNKSFEFISIECESTNTFFLLRNKKKNAFNYKYLIGDQKVQNDYKIDRYPLFFFIDKDRMVRKSIIGYNSKLTEGQILNEINFLLSQ